MRADSSTSHPRVSSMRQSAGTMSPAFSSRTSPRTSWIRSISLTRPPRRTSTCVVIAYINLSIDASARTRCTPPMRAFAAVTPATSPASVTEPTAAASPAPTASTGVSGFASSPATARANETRGDPSAGSSAWRRAASATESPRRDDPSARSTASGVMACQAISAVGAGAGRRPSDDPARVPAAWAASAATFTGTAARRDALEAGPRKDHAAPTAEPAAEKATLRVLTERATGRDSTTRCASASPGRVSKAAPQGGWRP